jgi:hypothetical protein
MLERFSGADTRRERLDRREKNSQKKSFPVGGRLSDLLSDFRFVTVTLGQLRQYAAIDHPLNFE